MKSVLDTHQRGWTLPTTLFALMLALSIMRLLSLESLDTSVIASEILHADKLRATIATTVRDARPLSTRCERLPVSHDGGQLSLEVCRESVRPFITMPTPASLPSLLVDYDSLFLSAIACPTDPRPTSDVIDPSPFATTDCHLSGDPQGSIILLNNIVGESLSFIHTGTEPLTLATPGRIVILDELKSSRDLLVVAGGDVRIATLSATSSSTVTVTIISSLGRIVVDRVGDGVSLLAAGRQDVAVPVTVPAITYPLPPFRAPSLYSFRPTN